MDEFHSLTNCMMEVYMLRSVGEIIIIIKLQLKIQKKMNNKIIFFLAEARISRFL